jgi:hypothetical protein
VARGRDRDEIVGHVIGADTAFARELGAKRKWPAISDIAAIEELREAIAVLVGGPSNGSPAVPDGWLPARRIAQHVLERAREMKDRAESWAGRRCRRCTRPTGECRRRLRRCRFRHVPNVVLVEGIYR